MFPKSDDTVVADRQGIRHVEHDALIRSAVRKAQEESFWMAYTWTLIGIIVILMGTCAVLVISAGLQ